MAPCCRVDLFIVYLVFFRISVTGESPTRMRPCHDVTGTRSEARCCSSHRAGRDVLPVFPAMRGDVRRTNHFLHGHHLQITNGLLRGTLPQSFEPALSSENDSADFVITVTSGRENTCVGKLLTNSLSTKRCALQFKFQKVPIQIIDTDDTIMVRVLANRWQAPPVCADFLRVKLRTILFK